MKKKLHFTFMVFKLNKPGTVKKLGMLLSCLTYLFVAAQNPLLLKSPIPGGAGRSINKIVSTKLGKTFFNTIDNANHFSSLWGLWATNGSQQATTKLSLVDGSHNVTEATLLTPLGDNKIVFAGDNEAGYGEIWVSDGSQAGTHSLESFNPGVNFSAIQYIAALGNRAFYGVYTSTKNLQLRATDGTAGGTILLHDFGADNGNSIFNLQAVGATGYFALNNGTTLHTEIWRTDGTAGGTLLVKDLGLDYGLTSDFMLFGNSFYFITISSTYGDYIWKSDGTTAGTNSLKQISASVNFENVAPSYAATSSTLYFTANNSINGKEIWKTDGTAAGTGLLQDLYVGSTGSNPAYLTVLNDQLYFTANSSYTTTGNELNHYTGGLFSGIDIFPGITGSNISNVTVQNSTLLFSASRSTATGNEFWVSDVNMNTAEIANINPGTNLSSNPSLITVNGSDAYFAASFDANGDGIDDPCIYKYTAPAKIWTGAVSTDVSVAGNWLPAGAPASSDDIVLPDNAANPITNPFLFCNNLTNNGSTINVGTGLVFVNGNFYNTGIINNASNGIFAITSSGAGTMPHTIGGAGSYTGQLTISGGLNTQLSSNFTVQHLRVEGADSIYLGPYNLQVDAFDLQIPRIITDSSGSFFMPVGASPVSFPVQSGKATSFTPVTITNTGVYDYFGVNVKDKVLINGNTGNAITQGVVNKTWYIQEQTPGGSNANITLQWNAADELSLFDRTHIFLNHYVGGFWDPGQTGTASGTGPYTFTRSGVLSFSPFSVSSTNIVLPVSLLNFTATRQRQGVLLDWQTSLEQNTALFYVERSDDGGAAFRSIAKLDAAGNSNVIKNYSYTDLTINKPVTYYRLKMVDINGMYSYSKVLAIKTTMDNNLLAFPNPAKNVLHVQATGNTEKATVQVTDITGKKLLEQQVLLNGMSSFSININMLPKGVYTLLLKRNVTTEHLVFIKD